MTPQRAAVHLAVAAGEAAGEPLALPRPGLGDSSPGCRRAGERRRTQLVLARPLDADEQVHAIEQRSAEAPAVAAQVALAANAAVSDAGEPAGARIGRRDQHEPGREHQRPLSAYDRHPPVLEWLPEGLQRRTVELRELIEEQDAVIGEGGLARGGQFGGNHARGALAGDVVALDQVLHERAGVL